jgi:hypothetical protein
MRLGWSLFLLLPRDATQQERRKPGPSTCIVVFAIFVPALRDAATLHDLNANQIAITTIATMMVPHTAGVTRFELPLRGESLAAWSNFIWIPWPWKPILRN